jgi:GNAT superfamily N-acetyltransferase
LTAGLAGCIPGSDSGLPARPAVHHRHCFNGHDLDIAGRTMGYDHSLYVPTTSCDLCQTLGLSRATWFEIDLRFAHEKPPMDTELVLAARPPMRRAGVGHVFLQLRGQPIGGLNLWLCSVDRRGVIGPVLVETAYRRRGFGAVLVAAARWREGRVVGGRRRRLTSRSLRGRSARPSVGQKLCGREFRSTVPT